jgi:transposase
MKAMAKEERAAARKLLQPCSAQTRERGAEHDDQSDPRRRAYATPCLYLAFELGSAEWKLGLTTEPGAKPRVRTMPARDPERLTREIAEAKKSFGCGRNAPVRSCYEARPDGFWLHRYLASIEIENTVVESSSIEVESVNRRPRRAKSDGLDVRKLLGMLLRYRAGEHDVWSVVRVPTVEEEHRR